MSEGAAPKGSGASCYVRGFQHPARSGTAPNLIGVRAMSNIYYLDDSRSPAAAASVAPVQNGLRARQQRGLEKAEALLTAMRAARAARQLKQPALVHPTLQAATPIVLYFVSYGRNAWHSTWVARYQRNTLMASYKEASHFIGARMTQGTAFKMTVTPGWHLQFSSSSFLVCEINTNQPFSRLREAAFVVPGLSEEEAKRLLEPTSSIWSGPTPRRDSVIVQQTKRPAGEFVSWEEADEERSSRDFVEAWFSNRPADAISSTSLPRSGRIYDPRKPWNYGRYIRDPSRETPADFFFTPCSKGGPAEFDCGRFRAFAAGAQVGATP